MNNLCVLPFNSISVTSDGKLRPCCNTQSYSYSNKIQDVDLEGILNNSDAISLRQSFIADKKDIRCDRCWKMEDLSNKSFRHVANESVDRGLHTIDTFNLRSKISYDDIRYIDITLGNKCNLACRMCNPWSSSLYAKQVKDLRIYDGDVNIDFDEKTRNKLLDAIKKSSNLSSIYMLGGEPLVNDFHDEVVDLLISTGRSKDIILHYSTNLQIDVEKYLELWGNFHIIELSISIDGTGNTYEYIRWPGSWDKLYRNLTKVVDYKNQQTRNLLYPSIATTAQNLNAHNLPDLIQTIKDLDKDMTFYFIPVTGGYYLEMTPHKVLNEAIERLSAMEDSTGRIAELINYYKSALTKTVDRESVKRFFEQQKSFDSYRKQNLFQTLPHFKDYANSLLIATWK